MYSAYLDNLHNYSYERATKTPYERMQLGICSSLLLGTLIGLHRGGRKQVHQYRAENLHLRPNTVTEWYFYYKRRNYKVILASLKGATAVAGRLAGLVMVYQNCEYIGDLMQEKCTPKSSIISGVLCTSVYATASILCFD